MNILFTQGNSVVSKLIRWALQSPISHVAIEKDGLIYHSNLLGLHIQPLQHFLKKSTVLHQVPVEDNGRLLQVMGRAWHVPYDFIAFLCMGLRAVLKKIVRLPKADIRQITGMYICTEFVTEVLDGDEKQLTPDELLWRLTNG